MNQIIPDTNLLVYLAENKLFDELDNLGFQILIPRIIDFELEKLGSNKNFPLKTRDAANLAQTIIKKWVSMKKAKYLELEENDADLAILHYAQKRKVFVATMDKELTRNLKEVGVKVFGLRQGKFIDEK
ncbi:MAG: PIN domain-containing protein [archaeon]